ncbi:MAG: tripartite tricarboxylate transporter substrate binding protein [Betaproteobacteria bacterium]
MKNLTLIFGAVSSLALGLAPCGETRAQDYPARAVRVVVPYAPGGSTDILTRIMGAKLTTRVGQVVVVDNRAGGNGIIGMEIVARSPADGYTLLMVTNGQTINVGLHANLPVDLERDLIPLVNVAAMPNLIVVHPSLPVKTLRNLIDLAKARPGSINYAHAGVGSAQHLAGEFFKLVAKVDIVGVPYKGGGPAVADAIAGAVSMVVAGVPVVSQYIAAGRLRAIAATSLKRSALLPDLPTVAESGYPGFDAIFWIALMAPRGVPPAIMQRLNVESNSVLHDPDIDKQFLVQGASPVGGTAAELGAYMRKDIETWRRVIKEANIKAE